MSRGKDSISIMFRGDTKSLTKSADDGTAAFKRQERQVAALVEKINQLEEAAKRQGKSLDLSGLAGLERMQRYLTVGAVAIRLWQDLTKAIDATTRAAQESLDNQLKATNALADPSGTGRRLTIAQRGMMNQFATAIRQSGGESDKAASTETALGFAPLLLGQSPAQRQSMIQTLTTGPGGPLVGANVPGGLRSAEIAGLEGLAPGINRTNVVAQALDLSQQTGHRVSVQQMVDQFGQMQPAFAQAGIDQSTGMSLIANLMDPTRGAGAEGGRAALRQLDNLIKKKKLQLPKGAGADVNLLMESIGRQSFQVGKASKDLASQAPSLARALENQPEDAFVSAAGATEFDDILRAHVIAASTPLSRTKVAAARVTTSREERLEAAAMVLARNEVLSAQAANDFPDEFDAQRSEALRERLRGLGNVFSAAQGRGPIEDLRAENRRMMRRRLEAQGKVGPKVREFDAQGMPSAFNAFDFRMVDTPEDAKKIQNALDRIGSNTESQVAPSGADP